MLDPKAHFECRYCNGSGWVLEPEDNTGNVGWFICRCVDKNNQCDDFIEDLIDSAGGLR